MQPRKLIMKNFGPFIHETLDFSEFENTGLFLISGKTGAGKTTIFDGMTYALFGQTSGNKRSGKEMRSLFADETEETEVFFEFEHNGLVYQIERRPEQVLAKKRGEGTTTRAMKASLTVLDTAGQAKQQFTKNVDHEIQELLHLSADQFFKIIMLPQGEFRNFLMASSKDKEQVLQRLFDTEIYQRLNFWLREKAGAAQKEIDEMQTQAETLVGVFQWHGEPQEGLSLKETLTQWEMDLQSLTEKIKGQEIVLKEHQKAVDQAEADFYKAQEIDKAFQEQTTLLTKQTALDEQALEMTTARQQIAVLSWFKEQQILMDNIRSSNEMAGKLQERLLENKSLVEKNQQSLTAWQEKRQEIVDLQKEMAKTSQQMLADELLLPIAKRATEISQQLESKDERLISITEEATAIEKKLATLATDMTITATVIKEKATWQQRELALLKGQQALEKWQQRVDSLKEKTLAFQTAKDKLQQSSTDEQQAEILVETATSRFQQLKQENIRMQIARLSLELTPGTPCPVCGSVTHPYEEQQHQQYSSEAIQANEEALAAAEDQLAAARQQQTATVVRHQQAGEAAAKAEADVTHQQEQTSAAWKEVATLSQGLFSEPLDEASVAGFFQAAVKAQQEQAAAIQAAEQRSEELATQQAAAIKEQAAIHEKIQQLKADRQDLAGRSIEYQGQLQGVTEDQLTARIQRLSATATSQQAQLTEDAAEGERLRNQQALLEQQRQELQARQAENAALQNRQQQILTEALADAPTPVAALLAAEESPDLTELPKLQQTVKAHETQMDFVKRRLAELSAQLLDQEQPDTDQLEAFFREAQQLLQQQRDIQVKAKTQQTQNKALKKQLQDLVKANEIKIAQQAELQQLSDTIYGRNSFKTSLERYVLQAYLAEILEVANSRLQLLSKGRYRFELAESTGGRGMQGLDIDIYDDDAGDTRRVQTMSGGESFIAALALALALADVIQNRAGGIPIEALFIDEGFGSLDEEALEMAMEALMTIEGEGRMIGIISHVAQLKERLARQVLVETNGGGQSRIKLKV